MKGIKLPAAITVAAMFLLPSLVGAWQTEQSLTAPSHDSDESQSVRTAPALNLDRDAAFARITGGNRIQSLSTRSVDRSGAVAVARAGRSISVPSIQAVGTGDGDIDEREPNDSVAQGVNIPVNVFGGITYNGDLDYFSFQAYEGQRITVEAFAARYSGSILIPDLLLFDTHGNLLERVFGTVNDDPVLHYTPRADQVLIAGIGDIEDQGGSNFGYAVNITAGNDYTETETADHPNNKKPEPISAVPVTVFGDITGTQDVDFYSFDGIKGETLIVDVDAEVFGSRLDAEINLQDPESKVEYFFNDQSDGKDPRFNIVLPYTGKYVVGIASHNGLTEGFYRMNLSVVPGEDAPVLTKYKLKGGKKLILTGSGFRDGTAIEVNTKPWTAGYVFFDSGTIRAKGRISTGDVITVASPQTKRRSNPLIFK